MGFIAWIVVGFVAGLLGRALGPGSARLGCLGTIALGLLGSVVGGTLANVLFDGSFEVESSGLIGSVIGAVVLLTAGRVLGRGGD